MLRLTREIGQPVVTSDGSRVGRVRDLVAGGLKPSIVRGVVVRRTDGDLLVSWPEVLRFERDLVTLRADTPPGEVEAGDEVANEDLHHDELLLARDVLDTQVIDTVGLRVARVSEVLLSRQPDDTLEVVGVDVSMGAVVRRLGLRALSRRMTSRVIEWSDLHLTSDRAHDVQLASADAVVHRIDSSTLAKLLAALSAEDAADILVVVGPARSAQAIAQVPTDVSVRVMSALETSDVEPVLSSMPSAPAGRLRRMLRRETAWSRRRFTRLGRWRFRRQP